MIDILQKNNLKLYFAYIYFTLIHAILFLLKSHMLLKNCKNSQVFVIKLERQHDLGEKILLVFPRESIAMTFRHNCDKTRVLIF